VLSTQNHGQPYCNLIAIAATDDLKYLSLCHQPRATRKYANLMADFPVADVWWITANEPGGFCRGRSPHRPAASLEVQGLNGSSA